MTCPNCQLPIRTHSVEERDGSIVHPWCKYGSKVDTALFTLSNDELTELTAKLIGCGQVKTLLEMQAVADQVLPELYIEPSGHRRGCEEHERACVCDAGSLREAFELDAHGHRIGCMLVEEGRCTCDLGGVADDG